MYADRAPTGRRLSPADRTVFVHIGPGKTGTSTIQRGLNEQREALRDFGIQVPGRMQLDTRSAVYDLMGRRIEGTDSRDRARVTAAWTPYAASITGSSLPVSVFSEEMLALARPRVVRRLVRSLAPRQVRVVATVRDLASALGSYWQQIVMMGRTETLAEFLSAVRDLDSGPAGAGVGFWMRQDLLRTLDSWERVVGREDLRLVAVPPRGAPPELLADRFAAVIGAPPGLLRSSRSRGNSSIGLAEVEALRRLNVQLDGRLREQQRLHLMRVVRAGLVDRPTRPIGLPADALDWVRERADGLTAELRARGYRLVGECGDLAPRADAAASVEPPEAEVADATLALLSVVTAEQARLFTRDRRHRTASATAPAARPPTSPVAGLASRGRALTFGLKTAALKRADDSALLGWAARTYLRRTSRPS